MKRKLIIITAILGILIFGVVALILSIQQEQKRNIAFINQVNAPAERSSIPTPTLQTSPSANKDEAELLKITHTVSFGETLLEISLNYDVSIDDIIQINELDNPDILSEGQSLLIPGVRPTSTASTLEFSGQGAIELIPKPQNVTVNGLAEGAFVIVPESVRVNANQIFSKGQNLNRNPRVFSVVGDSTTEIPFFLARDRKSVV